MKYFRNFLAFWAGILLSAFLIVELIEAAEAVIANAANAFEFVTDWRLVLISMGVAIILAIIFAFLPPKQK